MKGVIALIKLAFANFVQQVTIFLIMQQMQVRIQVFIIVPYVHMDVTVASKEHKHARIVILANIYHLLKYQGNMIVN